MKKDTSSLKIGEEAIDTAIGVKEEFYSFIFENELMVFWDRFGC
jgi:hypothetical protein